MKPALHFADIDTGLEMALAEARVCARRLHRGRVVLVLEKLDGQVAEWYVERDLLTDGDYERIMRRPKEGK